VRAIVAVSPQATAATPSCNFFGSIVKPSPQTHSEPSARSAAECREPVAMATAPSKIAPQRSALSPRPCDDSGP
jgi:hypothetical protein